MKYNKTYIYKAKAEFDDCVDIHSCLFMSEYQFIIFYFIFFFIWNKKCNNNIFIHHKFLNKKALIHNHQYMNMYYLYF